MIFNEQISTGFLIHDVARLRRNIVNNALAHIGLTRTQRWALAYIVRAGSKGMIQSDLARAMNVGKVSLGATIKHLEQAGLISRDTDPDDLRVKRVIVTDKGLDATIRMTVIVEKLNQDFWKGIDEAKLKEFAEILEVMMGNMVEMDGA
ncbi:MAG: winged helix DNA-binding protein [Gammaproteobacteria bacterium]|nr:winged helix DNA-binding protein [Gammaproteobacteria bacterium]